MRLKEFEYPIDKRIDQLKHKYQVDKRLTFLVFYCIRNSHNNYIGAQFESPSFRKLENDAPSGPAAYFMNSQRTAELLNLDYNSYRDMLITNFNAYVEYSNFTKNEHIYFHSKKDALRAFEWVESIIFFDDFNGMNK